MKKLALLLLGILMLPCVVWAFPVNKIIGDDNSYIVDVNSSNQLEVSVNSSSTTSSTAVYQATAPWTISDDRYDSKVSTATTGRILADGDITADFNIDYIWFYAADAEITVTGSTVIGGDTIYCQNAQETILNFSVPTTSATNALTVDLTAGDTLYYMISGVIAE